MDKVKPLELDFDNCRDRIVRLTVNSSNMGDAILDSKGEKIYYQAAFEGGYDLWCHNLKEGSTRTQLWRLATLCVSPYHAAFDFSWHYCRRDDDFYHRLS